MFAMLTDAPATIARDACALLAGTVPQDASPSEAEYRLALLASFHTARPEVVAAVLEATSLSGPKWRNHPAYLDRTISKAMHRRGHLAERALTTTSTTDSKIVSLIGTGKVRLAGLLTTPETPHCELMGHLRSGESKTRVASAVLAFLATVRDAGVDSAFWRDEGWVRVPVCDLADLLACDRNTVARALRTLAAAGLTERRAVGGRVAGSPRADSLAWLTAELEGDLWG